MRILYGKDQSTPLSAAHGGCSFPRSKTACCFRAISCRQSEFMQNIMSAGYGFQALNELKAEGLITRFPNKAPLSPSASPLHCCGSGPAGSSPVSCCRLLPPPPFLLSRKAVPPILLYRDCLHPAVLLRSVFVIHGKWHTFCISHRFLYLSPFPELQSFSGKPVALQKCIDTGISGIVLFPQDQPYFSERLLYLLLQKYPLVLIDRNLPRLDTSYVIGDNKTGGALCLRHLHALGHQRFCFVSSARRDTFTVRSRIDGILQEAEARNIPESSITIWDFFNKHQPYVHYQKQMMKLIREERITAFIAANPLPAPISTACLPQ